MKAEKYEMKQDSRVKEIKHGNKKQMGRKMKRKLNIERMRK